VNINDFLINLDRLAHSQISVDTALHSYWTYIALYGVLLITMGKSSTVKVLTKLWADNTDLRRAVGACYMKEWSEDVLHDVPLTENNVKQMIGCAIKHKLMFHGSVFMLGITALFSPVISVFRLGISTVYYPVALVGKLMFHSEIKNAA